MYETEAGKDAAVQVECLCNKLSVLLISSRDYKDWVS